MNKALLVLIAMATLAGTRSHAEERGESLLLLDNGATIDPGAGKLILNYDLGYARPTCVNCVPGGRTTSTPEGLEQSVGARLGIGSNASIAAQGILSTNSGNGQNASGGGGVEAATRIIDPSRVGGWDLGVAAGWLNNHSVNHARFRMEGRKEFGDFTVGAESLFDRQFQDGADGVDVLVSFGVSYRVLPAAGLGIGIEYTGQDIEGMFGDEAEGGARQTIGPTVSWQPKSAPVRVLVGPAVSFGPDGTRPVGRVGFSMSW